MLKTDISQKKSAKQMSYWCMKKKTLTSSQDGGISRYTLPPHTTKIKTTTILKQNITRTARKSNYMEVRQPRSTEEIFIQTGKRGGDGQPGWR